MITCKAYRPYGLYSKDIAMILGVSEKTITRYIKEIPNIKIVGKGENGYWELND